MSLCIIAFLDSDKKVMDFYILFGTVISIYYVSIIVILCKVIQLPTENIIMSMTFNFH